MKALWTIARRELKALFDHPTGYILLVVFVAINDFLFFRQVFVVGVASLRPMLDVLPWLFLFFIPAVSMRALAEDTRTGTIEIVLAQPVSELELLLGKYVGQLLFIWVGLALTLPIPFALSFGADLPLGVVFAQYFGSALLAAGLTGVGVWASSLTKNQITAFIVGVAVMFVLILVGLDPLIVGLPPALGTIAARLGVLSHFHDITRGVIDLRDVLYFLTLAAIFLSLAYWGLMRRKLAPAGGAVKRLRVGVTLLVAALVVLDLLGGYIGGRLDFTPGKAYTLSGATKKILHNLDDLVTIKLFVSDKLPSQIALLRRDVNDLLSDYRSAGNGKVKVVVVNPASGPADAKEARDDGIPPVRFNVVGKSELSVQQGWFGLDVRYGDQHASIPLIRRTDDLEYRLTSMIHGFTDTTKHSVGLAIETKPGMQTDQYNALRQELTRNYKVRTVDLSHDSLSGLNVLVIAGEPDSFPPAQAARMNAYLAGGGGALFMVSGMSLSPQYPFARSQPIFWNQVLKPYGVKVNSDMVHDLVSNQPVSMRTRLGQLLAPYPFWVMGVSTRETPVNEEITNVFLPWPSSIDTTHAVAGTVTPLIETSRGGGARSGMVPLSPQQQWPHDSLGHKLLAVLVNPLGAKQPTADSLPKGRLVVVGDADFASDNYARDDQTNLAFALNAIDWLAQDDALLGIRAKSRTPPPLAFTSDAARNAAKYLNIVGVPLLLILLAAVRLTLRRQKTRRRYTRAAEGGAA